MARMVIGGEETWGRQRWGAGAGAGCNGKRLHYCQGLLVLKTTNLPNEAILAVFFCGPA